MSLCKVHDIHQLYVVDVLNACRMPARCLPEHSVTCCGRLGFRRFQASRGVYHHSCRGGRTLCKRLYSLNQDPEGVSNIVRQQGGDSGHAVVEQPSAELLELVKVQLDMLVSMLESRIRDAFVHMDIGVRCAMYCRTPGSITSRTLKLQLVATSDDRWDVPDNSTVFANEFIIGDEISADAEEAWVINQPMIVLPDNGGLILPLTHKSFLVGLLLVERTLPNLKNTILPPVHDVFGPAEIGIIKQSGVALSMSCAMDLRAVMERAGARMQQERLQGLLTQASKPLSTLKTLGRMLQPRLSQGEPERDMTDSMVAQGQYLGDVLSQIQSVINVSDSSASTTRQFLPRKSTGNEKNTRGDDDGAMQRKKAKIAGPSYPALPSSSIGADNWDSLTISSTDDDDAYIISGGSDDEKKVFKTYTESSSTLAHVVHPLFDAAMHYSSIKGFVFNVDDQDGIVSGDVKLQASYSSAKHIYSVLLDGAISSVDSGDTIDIQMELLTWKNKPGVFMAIFLSQSNGEHQVALQDLPVQLGMEIDALVEDVEDLGGWLQFHDDVSNPTNTSTQDDKSVLCSLWLPLAVSHSN
jgi:hypothetical protein